MLCAAAVDRLDICNEWNTRHYRSRACAPCPSLVYSLSQDSLVGRSNGCRARKSLDAVLHMCMRPRMFCPLTLPKQGVNLTNLAQAPPSHADSYLPAKSKLEERLQNTVSAVHLGATTLRACEAAEPRHCSAHTARRRRKLTRPTHPLTSNG
jgi:hypothetical protein